MDRYVAYYRVSTSRQGASGLGFDAQQASVRQFAAERNGEIIAELTEIESGKCASRPILREALARCRKERATLVIAKLDRLARNVAFVSSLMEAGTEFVAVDAPYANRLMLHILAAFAENEREQISQRTKAALAAAKRRGVLLGRHGRVLADQHKAEAAMWAENIRRPLEESIASGNRTLDAHASFLNRAGISSREGGRFCAANVSRAMRRLGIPTHGNVCPSVA